MFLFVRKYFINLLRPTGRKMGTLAAQMTRFNVHNVSFVKATKGSKIIWKNLV